MKIAGLTYLLLMLLCPWAAGQSLGTTLLGTTGDFKSGSYSLSYSVGELLVTSSSSGNYFLTQGFQQPYLVSKKQQDDTVSWCYPECPQLIKVYPNPVEKELNIQFYKLGINNFSVEIYNIRGSKVLQVKYSNLGYGEIVKINFEDLPKELYLIYAYSSDGKLMEKFKVIKI